jgi:hypothetical protein
LDCDLQTKTPHLVRVGKKWQFEGTAPGLRLFARRAPSVHHRGLKNEKTFDPGFQAIFADGPLSADE